MALETVALAVVPAAITAVGGYLVARMQTRHQIAQARRDAAKEAEDLRAAREAELQRALAESDRLRQEAEERRDEKRAAAYQALLDAEAELQLAYAGPNYEPSTARDARQRFEQGLSAVRVHGTALVQLAAEQLAEAWKPSGPGFAMGSGWRREETDVARRELVDRIRVERAY